MFAKRSFFISSQVVIAVAVLLGLNSTAQANSESSKFKPSYKVEKCDCFSFNENIPTFLSDLTGGALDISGEGQTLQDAKKQAKNMCVESYRAYASVSSDNQDVTESGCHQFRSTLEGDWESI